MIRRLSLQFQKRVKLKLCHYCAKDYYTRVLVREKDFRDRGSGFVVEWECPIFYVCVSL